MRLPSSGWHAVRASAKASESARATSPDQSIGVGGMRWGLGHSWPRPPLLGTGRWTDVPIRRSLARITAACLRKATVLSLRLMSENELAPHRQPWREATRLPPPLGWTLVSGLRRPWAISVSAHLAVAGQPQSLLHGSDRSTSLDQPAVKTSRPEPRCPPTSNASARRTRKITIFGRVGARSA